MLIDIINWLLLLINIPMLILFTIWTLVLLLPGKEVIDKDYNPKLSVLIPAYNEEKTIGECIRAVLASNYPKVEITVIDDGSTDKTSEIAKKNGVRVIKTNHLGKASALNDGLRKVNGDIIVVIDADSKIKKDALTKLASQFNDKDVGVASGLVKTGGSSIIERFQKIEYAFVSALIKQHSNVGIPIPFVYGAVSAFRKKALEDIGGFKGKTLVEDSDTYLEIIFKGWKAKAVDAMIETKPAKSLAALVKQRIRWMFGGLQVIKEHVHKFGNGLAGMYVLPLFGFWPVGTGLSLLLNAYIFTYWFNAKSIAEVTTYILRWISFIGVPLGFIQLPEWGFPIPAATGITIGLFSLLVLIIGMLRSEIEFDLVDILLLLFYPIYGWIVMGISGIIAMIQFITNPNKYFKK